MKLVDKLKQWDGSKRLTAREYAVMHSIDTRAANKAHQRLRKQRLAVMSNCTDMVVVKKREEA